MRIGNIDIHGRAFLAPMAGITDAPFRKLASSLGAPLVISEMIASDGLMRDNPDMIAKALSVGARPHVVQIAGREAYWLAESAKRLADHGADIIDINLGCPAKKVTTGLCGAALMRDPAQAGRLVEATVAASPIPVTVKMRLGWDDKNINAPTVARIAVGAGAQAVTVHGRTRQQFYKGKADWAAIRAVRQTIDVPLTVNGDIVDIDSARLALEQSGADAVMIGRGAQGRPWLPAAIGHLLAGRSFSPPPPSQLARLIATHYDDMLNHYGTAIGLRAARKHLVWYMEANLPQAIWATYKPRLVRLENPDDVKTLIKEAFSQSLDTGCAA